MAAVVLILSGCSAIQPFEQTNVRAHLLDADFGPAVLDRNGPVVLVSQMDERPGYNTRNMLYVSANGELNRFGRNLWVAAPAAMLTPLMVQALEASGQFAAVVGPAAALPADYRVITELVRLEQDFTATPSRVVMTLRVIFVRVAGSEILWSEVLHEEEPATSDDPIAGAAAASRAAERALTRLSGHMIEILQEES